jgi:hypothetical protein
MIKHILQNLSRFKTNFQNITPNILYILPNAQQSKITSYILCASNTQISEIK